MELREALEQNGIKYARPGEHHHARHGWTQIDCPICSPNSGKYRLGINNSKLYANCWHCGSISLAVVFKSLLDCSYSIAKQIVRTLNGSGYLRDEREKKLATLKIPKGLVPLMKAHRRYLEEARGFNPDELVRLWNIQAFGLHIEYAWRIFIPITMNGRLVSWTTRSISSNAKLRYRTAPEDEESYSAKRLLYGEEYCRATAIISEGPTDVWNIGPSACSVNGLSYTQEQLFRMSRYPVRVVCFDSSKDAQRRAEKLCDDLHVFPGDTYQIQLDAEDPGSASKKEVRKLRKSFGLLA